MTDAPNPDDFSFVDKPTEFRVTYSVTGEFTETITADSKEQAYETARARALEVHSNEICIEEPESVDVSYVRSTPRMYRVTDADGRKMQVSRLEPGMAPREPDERGF